jgi:hypothetical protein
MFPGRVVDTSVKVNRNGIIDAIMRRLQIALPGVADCRQLETSCIWFWNGADSNEEWPKVVHGCSLKSMN